MDDVPCGVRLFGGHCAWVARWTGGGSDSGEVWRVERLSKDLSACPRSRGVGLRFEAGVT